MLFFYAATLTATTRYDWGCTYFFPHAVSYEEWVLFFRNRKPRFKRKYFPKSGDTYVP